MVTSTAAAENANIEDSNAESPASEGLACRRDGKLRCGVDGDTQRRFQTWPAHPETIDRLQNKIESAYMKVETAYPVRIRAAQNTNI